MDDSILIQYLKAKEEITAIKKTICDMKKTGGEKFNDAEFNDTEFNDTQAVRLKKTEVKLLDLACQLEELIQNIDQSELRIMLRLYYLDGLTWKKVAMRMNRMLPGKYISYTEDSCRMRIKRFLRSQR